MKVDHIRAGINERIGEARSLLGLLTVDNDFPNAPKLVSTNAILKGMIYISLYSALEYCVTQGVQTFLSFVSSSKVRYAHLEFQFNAVALDPFLTTIRTIGEKKKWPARRAIFENLENNSVCVVPDTAFGTYLHNIWPSTIEEIFACFGINLPPTSTPREIGYLTEVVEKRNAIAHGRDTASEVGEGMTVIELQLRMDAIYSVCFYFLSALEEHTADLRFVRARYRRTYRTAA